MHSFFRKVRINGKQNLQRKGPVIFVANHPSALIDPLAVGITAKQPLYFLAAAEFFGKGIKKWFFETFLHMIPVYRPNVLPGQAHKNDQMFRKCYVHLGKGKSICLFPEGSSATEKRLRKLKTGAARIALAAFEHNENIQDITIIPVGLNYSSAHDFRSDLVINVGKPLSVNDFRHGDDSFKEKVTRLTEAIEEHMQASILHIDELEDAPFIEKVEKIYKNDLQKEFTTIQSDTEFIMQKELITAFNHFKETAPEKVESLHNKVNAYFYYLKTNEVDYRLIENPKGWSMKDNFFLTMGFPFHVVGLIHNYLPYWFTGVVVGKMKLSEAFVGSLVASLGFLFFLAYYLLFVIPVAFILDSFWWGFAYFWMMYGSGLYSLTYLGLVRKYKLAKQSVELMKHRQEVLANIIVQRKEILEELEQLKEEYLRVNQ